jgi:hypothetical protein
LILANSDHHAKIYQPNGIEQWSQEFNGQVTATVLLINWTEQTESAFEEMEAEDPDIFAMERHASDMTHQLSTFVKMI